MATARLGGFAPQIGFFAFIAGSLGFALLGANRVLSCGADSTITPIFAGGLAATGSADDRALASPTPKLLVLEAGGIPEIDFAAAQALRDLIKAYAESGVTVAVARLESLRAQAAFERFGLYDVLPRQRIFRSVEEAVRALAAAP
jgi:MFS superfamily sulfate permease-like transporter